MSKTTRAQICLMIPPALHKQVVDQARSQRRSISNMLECIIAAHFEQPAAATQMGIAEPHPTYNKPPQA